MEAREFQSHRVFVAWLAGPLAVSLGVAAHLVSGESVPPASVLGALTALLSMAASMIAHLKFPGWVLVLLSGMAQQVLHLAFNLFSGVAGSGSAGHGHGILPWEPPQLSSPSRPPAHAMELMLDAHVAAALLTALAITTSGRVLSRIPLLQQRGSTGSLPSAFDSSFGAGK
jgi:hypothetical protein